VLYLHYSSSEASPKAISGRTSYLRVRLEFLRYPQLIPWFFNTSLVRASIEFYLNFTLAMDRSPGFGSTACNLFALFRLGFPSAPPLNGLTSLHTVTRWLVLQKARRHSSPGPHKASFVGGYRASTACRHTVSGSISLPSRGSFHLSLTVLLHYRSLGSI
jgi:hypothetical protein